MSKFFAALFAVCLLASHTVSAQSYGWYFIGYSDNTCDTQTADLYKLSTTISKSGAGSFSLLSTATAATGVYTVTSYADEAKTKTLPSITLPDAFTDAKTIGCFQLKNVESQASTTDSGVYGQFIIDQSVSPNTATLTLYSDATCTTVKQNGASTPADISALTIEIGSAAAPTKCYDITDGAPVTTPSSNGKPIKSVGIVSATASGVTTYSVFGYSDPVSASTTCATTSSSVFSSSVTSVINGCLSVGSYVNSNAAASVYAVINSIDISGSGKKFKAKFFSDKSCKTAVDASQKVIDTKITTRQALSGTAIYGKLAATTAPYVFYTVADTSDTPFAVAYVTNLCQDVSTLSLTNTKSLHVYLDGASATPYAVGFSKTTCTADSTNVAGSPLPITLQLKTASTLTCQKVSSDLYAKIKQDGSDDYKFAFTFYKQADCLDTSALSKDIFVPKCTATGFASSQGPAYAELIFAVPPTSNSGLLRFGLFALLASVIALIF